MVAKVEQKGRLRHQGSGGGFGGVRQEIPQLWHLGKPIKPLHLTDHCMKVSVQTIQSFCLGLLQVTRYFKHREENCDNTKTLIKLQLNSHELKDFC